MVPVAFLNTWRLRVCAILRSRVRQNVLIVNKYNNAITWGGHTFCARCRTARPSVSMWRSSGVWKQYKTETKEAVGCARNCVRCSQHAHGRRESERGGSGKVQTEARGKTACESMLLLLLLKCCNAAQCVQVRAHFLHEHKPCVTL